MTAHYERFFTFWAFISHILYIIGLFPCTLLIALCTCIGSVIHNVYINKQYSVSLDVFFHHLPLAILAAAIYLKALPVHNPYVVFAFTCAFALSYVVFNGGYDTIRKYYSNTQIYFYDQGQDTDKNPM